MKPLTIHAGIVVVGISCVAQAAPKTNRPAVPISGGQATIQEARQKLRGVPSCLDLETLREKLSRVEIAANDVLGTATVNVLREEVHVRLRKCPPNKSTHTDPATVESPSGASQKPSGQGGPGPAKPSAVPGGAKKSSMDDSMALIDAQEKVLSSVAMTCRTPECRASFDAFSEDLLRLMLTVYSQAKPGDAVLPRLREKLGLSRS